MIKRILYIWFLTSMILYGCDSCNDKKPSKAPIVKKINVKNLSVPEFNADSSYFFIEKQVGFGPRVPNLPPHDSCRDWLENKLKSYGFKVYIQKTSVKAFDNTSLAISNIIAAYNPANRNRLLLCAHWDTRPFAERDIVDKDKPIPGANDGGSGVGILLEIARQINLQPVSIGIDIILFDAEDYGKSDIQNSYCLGSQYWAKNPHVKQYIAQYGILLDMVGAKNAKFTLEGTSMEYAPKIMRKIWDIANQIGYSNYFVFKKTPGITDDHGYINEILGIQTIDIIQYDEETVSKFGVYWHTHQDNMSVIEKATLKAVGQTILTVIHYEDKENRAVLKRKGNKIKEPA